MVLFPASVQATEHTGGLPNRSIMSTELIFIYLFIQNKVSYHDILTGLTLLLLVVVSAFDSAPSLANTEVRFKPFQGAEQQAIRNVYTEITVTA